MSKSKIQLINFTEKEKNKLSEMSIIFDRGYLSDAGDVIQKWKTGESVVGLGCYYHFPYSIYEYKTIIINLNRNEELDNEWKNTHRAKLKDLPRNLFDDFSKGWLEYWSKKNGVLIIFSGNYSYEDLSMFGLNEILLKEVVDRDITCECTLDDKTSFRHLLKEISPEIKMPTDKYIEIKRGMPILSYPSTTQERGFSKMEASEKIIYKNLGDKILGCYFNFFSPNDLEEFKDQLREVHAPPSIKTDILLSELGKILDRPRVIILPQFRDNVFTLKRLLKELAQIYPNLLPEIYEPYWINTDKYYPKEVKIYDYQIKSTKKKANDEIEKLKQEKEQTKQKYEFLREILYASGEELKRSVIKVLIDIFKIETLNADEHTDKKELAEDILIKHSDKQILCEVKGVKSINPSPTFIGQVWKHIALCKDRNISDGALILNYDINNDPEGRSLAYTGEHEEAIKDIIFIDSRVLFNLTIAIIDYGLPVTEAQEILLKKGRVTFDLKKFIKSIKHQ